MNFEIVQKHIDSIRKINGGLEQHGNVVKFTVQPKAIKRKTKSVMRTVKKSELPFDHVFVNSTSRCNWRSINTQYS